MPALREGVQAEAEAIAAVARHSCPLRVVLERVVATPSGTVLACWQLAGGTDPTHLRRALRLALPNAPAEQVRCWAQMLALTVVPLGLHSRRLCTRMSGTCLCANLCGRPPSTRTLTPCCCAMLRAKQTVKDEAILHTTLARVVAPPVATAEGSQAGAASGPAEALQRAVQAMTRDLCGIQAVLDKLWWVKPGRGGAGHGVAGLMLVYLCRPVQRYLRWAVHHLKTPAPLLRLLVAVRAYPCQPGCLGLNRVISRLARGVLTTCPGSPCLSPCTPHPTQPAPAPPPHTPPHTTPPHTPPCPGL